MRRRPGGRLAIRRRRRERQLEAYRDGELSHRARERVERRLDSDPEAARHTQRMEALGAAIREAWSEGPSAPSPEFLVGALRPQMVRVDEELAARSPWRRLRERLGEVLRPAPVTALAGTVVAAFLLVLLGPPVLEEGSVLPPGAIPTIASPAAIYDLNQEEDPLLVYEIEDGITVIWVLEDDQGISGKLPRAGRWA